MSSPDAWLRVPYTDLLEAQAGGLHKVYKDRWWALDADDNVMFYQSTAHPQCNKDLAIVQHLAKNIPVEHCQFIRLPTAYVPVKLSDLV